MQSSSTAWPCEHGSADTGHSRRPERTTQWREAAVGPGTRATAWQSLARPRPLAACSVLPALARGQRTSCDSLIERADGSDRRQPRTRNGELASVRALARRVSDSGFAVRAVRMRPVHAVEASRRNGLVREPITWDLRLHLALALTPSIFQSLLPSSRIRENRPSTYSGYVRDKQP